ETGADPCQSATCVARARTVANRAIVSEAYRGHAIVIMGKGLPGYPPYCGRTRRAALASWLAGAAYPASPLKPLVTSRVASRKTPATAAVFYRKTRYRPGCWTAGFGSEYAPQYAPDRLWPRP